MTYRKLKAAKMNISPVFIVITFGSPGTVDMVSQLCGRATITPCWRSLRGLVASRSYQGASSIWFKGLTWFQPPSVFYTPGIDARSWRSFATAPAKSDETLLDDIKQLVRDHHVVLFMKGDPDSPRCGFSKKAVRLLFENGAFDFTYVDVLRSTRVRELVKTYSGWPTIPQLFIHGEFVGGTDIMESLHASGELQELISKKTKIETGATQHRE